MKQANNICFGLYFKNIFVRNGYTDIDYLANKIPTGEIFSLDTTTHQLIGGFVYSYIEIDLETKAVKDFFLKEELDKYSIVTIKKTSGNQFTNTNILLTASFAMKPGYDGFTNDWTDGLEP
ncbi:hypothetical protein [Polluticaenibacter yanchengensis]|uniref:Uncharacterized protein n=1 Tax=Polluticaenibacter yanchengensis TaxID=3014562 RepID=A0ABT4UNA5_9BACT|nr:hypothetical protein [Chitinophagaceae bacterium LY-5]